MEEVAVFRASKRRKLVRPQQDQSSEPEELLVPSQTNNGGDPAGNNDTQEENDPEIDVSSLIRARKQIRRPATGVQFSNNKALREAEEETDTSAIVKSDQTIDRPLDIANRFVGSSGQVVNVDKHMIQFIDSEMSRRRQKFVPPPNDSQRPQAHEPGLDKQASDGYNSTLGKQPPNNPSSHRQLAEVDLGSLAHDTNLARIQAALERAKSGQPVIEETPKPPKPRKPRIGRDGKPMKPRPRKRRDSEDIVRDALVEQVLRENRLDLYETDTPERINGGEDPGDAGDSDERIAEQFRQEFMDAMAERQHHRKLPVVQSKASGAGTAESKGPKLGGSRSARAKMVQMQQQQRQQPGQGPGKK